MYIVLYNRIYITMYISLDFKNIKIIMDLDKILDEFELNNEKGLVLGSLRLADLDIEFLNDYIRRENEKDEIFKSMLNPNYQKLYNIIGSKMLTYDEFITLPYTINERSNKRYKKNLEGFFEYMQEVKPQLANFFLDYRQPYFKDSVRHCHTYITGKSGLGKSEIMKNIIINHILRKNCAVVVIEPHGDLARQIYQSQIFLEKDQAKRLVVIDDNLDVNYTPIINIFDQIQWEHKNPIETEKNIDRISQEYAKTLTTICLTHKTADLSYKMEVLLRHCVRVILRKKDGCLQDLKRFMTDNNTDLIEQGAKDPNPETQNFFINTFHIKGSKGYDETKAAINNRLENILQDLAFQNLTTGKSTIYLKKFIDEKKVIIVNLSRGGTGSFVSSSVGKLILAVIGVIGIQREKLEYRTYTQVFIDEFSNYVSGTMREFLEEMRKYNIFLTLANQFVGQDLDTDQMKSIFANTGMLVIAQTSPTNSSKIADELKVKNEVLHVLEQGEYYLRYANSKKVPKTIKIKGVQKYLGDSFSMVKKYKSEWEALKTAQISTYYKKIGFHKYKPPKMQQKPNNDDLKGNTNKYKPRKDEDSPNVDDLSV